MGSTSPKPKKPTRRHHYTPVLYLKKFTDGAGALHVVNRQSGGRFETSPYGIGFERNLYWPDDLQDGDDPEFYENQFRQFEGNAAAVIHEVVERREMPTDENKLQLLFNFIAFQYVRTPSARRLVAAPQEQTARIIIDMLENAKERYESHMRQAGYSLEEHPWEKFRQGKGKYEPQLTTEGFIEGATMMMNAILKWLHQRTWTVISSDRPRESFVVSDHPVVLEWSDGRRGVCRRATRTSIQNSLFRSLRTLRSSAHGSRSSRVPHPCCSTCLVSILGQSADPAFLLRPVKTHSFFSRTGGSSPRIDSQRN